MNVLPRGLNRNHLKWIAVVCMLLDHTAALLLPAETALYYAFRFLGRVTAPVMLFFLAQGFAHTSDRRRYALRLFLFALASQIPYTLARYGRIFIFRFSMIWTLLLCLLVLAVAESALPKALRILLIGGLTAVSVFGDWGVLGPLAALAYHFGGADRTRRALTTGALALAQVLMAVTASTGLVSFLWDSYGFGGLLAIPALLAYNGEPGSRSPVAKWSFYVIYPAHLLLIWGIKTVIFAK